MRIAVGLMKTLHWEDDLQDSKFDHLKSINSVEGPRRLALGTVQFGLPYGIANAVGKIRLEHAEEMIESARHAGIDTLDTAISYGDAEVMLGRIGVSDFRIISKVPALGAHISSVEDWIVKQAEASLTRLRVSRLGGLMLHSPNDLIGPQGPGVVRGMLRVREAGLAERIGLSVYHPEQLDRLSNVLPLEILQIPANVFDRRFFASGWLSRLAETGVEVHARSVLLQGLLTMPPESVPSKFAPFRQIIDRWHDWVYGENFGVSPVQACLAHVASYEGIARLVVGADSLSQLHDLIASAAATPQRAPEALASPCSLLIDPTQWNKL